MIPEQDHQDSDESNLEINNKSDTPKKTNYFILQKIHKKCSLNDEDKQIINEANYINKEKFDQFEDKEFYYINLFLIILEDYKTYSNYDYVETISNIEKFVVRFYGDFNEINLIYKFEKKNISNESLKLFGEVFVNKNKENCFLIINEKMLDLSEYINLSDILDNRIINDNLPILLDVKLIERKSKIMTDLSFMFENVSTLDFESNFDYFKSKNIKNMSYMFYNCFDMEQLPDLSNLDTSNVTDMSYMFYNCSSITKIPDISKWNVNNVNNTSNMFANCFSLISVPDISIWNIKNFKNMSSMFQNCKSLSYFPNISKWMIGRYTNIDDMFEGCFLLKVNTIKKEFNTNFIMRCLKNIFICLINIGQKLSNYIQWYKVLHFIFLIITIAIGLFFPICLFHWSFDLNKASKCINNPIKYSNLTDISHISKLFKENQNDFINYVLNYTEINGNRAFESDQRYFIIYNLIIGIVVPLNVIILFCLNCKNLNKYINFKKFAIVLNLVLLLDICSIITGIFNIKNIERIRNSLNIFYNVSKAIFKIKRPKANLDEIKSLEWSLFLSPISCVALIFSFSYISSSFDYYI